MMRDFLALALMLAGPLGAQDRGITPPSSPQGTATFAPKAAKKWISFTWKPNGVIVIPVLLDGTPAKALVDTGFPAITLSRRWAKQHGQTLTPGADAYSFGGNSRSDKAPSVSLSVGDFHQTIDTVDVVDFDGVNALLDEPFDVALGSAFLSRFAMEIDFDRHRLRFLPSGTQTMRGTDIPVRLVPYGNRVVLDMTVDGRTITPVFIDLGSTDDLSMTAAAFKTLGHDSVRMTDLAAQGAGGVGVTQLGSFDTITLGSVPFHHVFGTVEPPNAFLDHSRMAGLIGLPLLAHNNLVLDVTAGHLTLLPRIKPDPPEAISKTGIQGLYQPDRLKIVHVMRNSPAAAAGLTAGDEICALNGEKMLNWKGTKKGKWGTGTAGKHDRLTLCDGRTVSLTTADFY